MAHEVSGGNEHSLGNWAESHSCSILAKEPFSFFPHSEKLLEVELKAVARIAFRLDYHSPISSIRQSKYRT